MGVREVPWRSGEEGSRATFRGEVSEGFSSDSGGLLENE